MEQQQLTIGEPAEIAGAVDDARVDARDFRRGAQAVDPRVDLVVVFGDRVAVRRGEHDVQLIEAAEAREEGAERLDDAAVARQQRQHVGVERQPARAFERDQRPTPSTRSDDEHAAAMRPTDDGGNEGTHE